MINTIQIPNSPQLFIEINRLIEAVCADNTDEFDLFENDVFILYDPKDEVESEDDDECKVLGSEIISPENKYQDIINESIKSSTDEDELDLAVECEKGNLIFFDLGMFGKCFADCDK